MGEDICKRCDPQRIKPPNIQRAHTAQYQKKHLNQKMSRRPKQTFLQSRHTDGQKVHEKMLNLTNYQKMQIKTKMGYHVTPVRIAIIKQKNLQKLNAGQDVKKRKHFYTVGGNVNWQSHYGEQYGGSLKI